MKLSECKRVVLFSYNKQNQLVEFRHYLINMRPTGVTKSIKRVITSQLPDLGKYDDISDYVLKENYFSDSEGEDTPESRVQIGTQGNVQQQSIRLKEIGPRMDLHLIKVQKDFCDGDVLFHDYITKTPEEIKELEKKRKERERLKQERKLQQEENIKRKLDSRGNEGENEGKEEKQEGEDEEMESDEGEDWEEDLKWYREEVGEDVNLEELKKPVNIPKGKYNPLYKKKTKPTQQTPSNEEKDSNPKQQQSQKPAFQKKHQHQHQPQPQSQKPSQQQQKREGNFESDKKEKRKNPSFERKSEPRPQKKTKHV